MVMLGSFWYATVHGARLEGFPSQNLDQRRACKNAETDDVGDVVGAVVGEVVD